MIVIAGSVVVFFLLIFIIGHLIRADSTEDETEPVVTEVSYENVSKVFTRLYIKDDIVYEVASVGTGVYVFKNGKNAGRSKYATILKECSLLDIKTSSNYIDIEEYKDDFVSNLYHLGDTEVGYYLGQLLDDGYNLLYRLDASSFNELILEKDGQCRRCLIANNTLMMNDIGNIESIKFNTEYYIDNYIY